MTRVSALCRMLFLAGVLSLSLGCATAKKNKELKHEIDVLKGKLAQQEQITKLELEKLRKKKDADIAHLMEEKDMQVRDLELARLALSTDLADEVAANRAELNMTSRGLVITLLSEILFDSGKSDIKKEALSSLGKVADVLNTTIKARPVAIEGYTDNVPIKYSGWKSNWELSSARALSVLNYFVDKKNVSPERLSIVGYGEYRPVASNETEEGRRMNRRVEIVVLPEIITKVREA